ncbi:MAG: tRNA (N6-threonylcarbamoyladenosine(37)-N6)-methyltransferase TrmO [Pseudomonadota bacterium]
MNFNFEQIAIIHSCYKEKFGIPRQAGLVAEATATIELLKPYNHPDMVKGLNGFSHIWLMFVFDQHIGKGFNHLVSPPRLNGKEQYGVYATRSPFRPNPIGLSVVNLDKIEYQQDKIFLHVKGADLLDKTPIIDIKPYIEYADSINNTQKGFISAIKDNNFKIGFSELANSQIIAAEKNIPQLRLFIQELLALDPRPHYNKSIKKHYTAHIYQYDLHWQINDLDIQVLSLELKNLAE